MRAFQHRPPPLLIQSPILPIELSRQDPPTSPPRAPPPSPDRRIASLPVKVQTQTHFLPMPTLNQPKAPPPSPFFASFLGRMLENDLEFLELTRLSGSLDEFSELMEMNEFEGEFEGLDFEEEEEEVCWDTPRFEDDDDDGDDEDVQTSWNELSDLLYNSHTQNNVKMDPSTPTNLSSPPDFSWTPSPPPAHAHKRKRSSEVKKATSPSWSEQSKRQRCDEEEEVLTPRSVVEQSGLDYWLQGGELAFAAGDVERMLGGFNSGDGYCWK